LSQIKALVVSAIDECFDPTKGPLPLAVAPQQLVPPIHTPQAPAQAPQQVPQNLSQYQAYQQAPQPPIQQQALLSQQLHVQDIPYD
jgi:hypothetical protein